MTEDKQRLIGTATGTHQNAFGMVEWTLLASVAAIWGSSFLFIAEGLESFRPAVITASRFVLGFATLALFPAARTGIHRSDWKNVAAVAVIWMALPMYLFPVAQQWVSSSLAGMINGAVPLFAAIVAALMLAKHPGRTQVVGLLIGFAGVALISARGGSGIENGYLGVAMLLFAVACYGVGINLAVPLQQKYGALPVLLRALGIAAVLTLPIALVDLPTDVANLSSYLAVIALGVLGTGLAFVAMTTLVGRAGATRGAVATYFIPIVALFLGVEFRDETASRLAIAGIVLILVRAWFTSRKEI